VLVVEDDAATRASLGEILAARGDDPRLVGTVEEAVAALDEVTFCYLLVDQQLPRDARSPALIGGGERVMAHARKKDRRRNEADFHVLPIVVLTGYSSDSDFVSKTHELGGDTFMNKPVTEDRIETLLDKIRVCLERARRLDHEACAGLALRPAPAEGAAEERAAESVHVALDAARYEGRMGLLVNGQRRELQDGKYLVLLRLAAVHARAPGRYVDKTALGIARSPETPSRIRQAFAGLVPAGFDVLEGDKKGSFRLNPAVVLAPIDWAALEEHPHDGVRKLAKEERRRRP
jgi:DNA-binding response OmpR family regulator